MDGTAKKEVGKERNYSELIKMTELLTNSMFDFGYFFNNIFSLNIDDFLKSKHFDNWSNMLQDKPNTCILAPRKHAKSTIIYAYLMWKILFNSAENKNLDILYISYKDPLASWHIKQMKQYIKANPMFSGLKDDTYSEGVGRYTWNGKNKITIEPAGILSFVRGRRANIVVLDDVLADPTTMLDLSIIRKINQRVYEDVFSIPHEGGEIKIVGTAQTFEDFFFQLKDNKTFNWGIFPAIVNENNKEVLWESLYPFSRLIEINEMMGGKGNVWGRAFRKEYLISPVYVEESYFTKEQILAVATIDHSQSVYKPNRNEEILAGWDIGKHAHPSHFSIFRKDKEENYYQLLQVFLEHMDYKDQLNYVTDKIELFGIDKVYYDATRGELEGFVEQGLMKRSIFMPVTFSTKSKNKMAAGFEKLVNQNKIRLINAQRQINQILVVTNDLQAVETSEGHGDAFWSIALAVGNEETESIEFLEQMAEAMTSKRFGW